MKFFPYPLIVYTLGIALGIALHHFLRFSYLFISIVVVLTLCLWLYAFLQTKRQLIPSVLFGVNSLILSLLLGSILHTVHIENQYRNHYTHYKENTTQLISGTIISELKTSEKQSKYLIEITSIEEQATFGKALLYIPKELSQHFIPDDKIVFRSQFSPLLQNLNPYQFNYADYLRNKQIYQVIFLKKQAILYIGNDKGFRFYLYRIKRKLLSVFESYNWEKQTTAIIEALILGERFLLDDTITQNYQDAGVMHILAISGLHIGILYLILLFLTNPLKQLTYGLFIQLFIILSLLWGFALLTGFSPSVSRAVTVFSLIALGKILNKTNAVYNLIAASALLLLLFNPNSLFDIGFQLSYAAVLSIVLFNPFFKYFRFSSNKFIIYFIDIILVSISAQIGVLPLSILYFNQFPILFLPANIVAIPLVTLVLILSLSLLICHFMIPALSKFIADLIEFFVHYLNLFIDRLAHWHDLTIRNIAYTPLLCFLSYTFIFSFLFWLYNKNFKNFRWVLYSLLFVQLGYIGTIVYQNNKKELILFHSPLSVLVQRTTPNQTVFFTNNPEENRKIIMDYKKGSFTDDITIKPLSNTFFIHKKRCLIIDSSGIYNTSLKPDIVILTQNPKINLERLIKDIDPQKIIADGSNNFYFIKIWKSTCRKEKIPFHATTEKGFYKF
ncbi:ComEC family competence protein [Flavobacterium sp. NRK F10]|uniref:ComEC/Rec2 family competence protein n=1 Tax=Flavobacterium sp. NRK F10 TaxID=2954931 RepID=UPI0020906689|nr:ComEC/Rec2 family competence protein [Flavobacterium sp. NRK F10]MCO6174502.1 ComEC family competence protein [Flavobacterium sp. NRK F10]